jgi:hypothetical protein
VEKMITNQQQIKETLGIRLDAWRIRASIGRKQKNFWHV